MTTAKQIRDRVSPDYIRLKEVPAFLKKQGIDITYDGLVFYKRLGLLDPPRKFTKIKEKYYSKGYLLLIFSSIKLIQGFFGVELKDVAQIKRKWGVVALYYLPYSFILAMNKLRSQKVMGKPFLISGLSIRYYANLFINMFLSERKRRFATTLSNVHHDIIPEFTDMLTKGKHSEVTVLKQAGISANHIANLLGGRVEDAQKLA